MMHLLEKKNIKNKKLIFSIKSLIQTVMENSQNNKFNKLYLKFYNMQSKIID
jgi:hypothetical protein